MRRVGFVGLVALCSLLVLPSTALASCAELPSTSEAIAKARTVFVGTVDHVENLRRWVEVDVADVWKGEVGDRVEVRAGPPDPPGPIQAGSSGDRSYKLGESYLFVLWDRSEPFRDDNCSATTQWGPELGEFNPSPGEAAAPAPRDLVNPRIDKGIAPEAIARWAVLVFSCIVLMVAVGRSTND
jgi:hypothetical protein